MAEAKKNLTDRFFDGRIIGNTFEGGRGSI